MLQVDNRGSKGRGHTFEAPIARRLGEIELADQLRLKTNLRYDIEICGCETLPRYEVKAKRFKDLRKSKDKN